MKVPKTIDLKSWIRFHAKIGVILGFFCGIIYSIGGLVVDSLVSLGLASGAVWETPGLSLGTLLAMGALIGMPVIFGFLLICAACLEALICYIFPNWFSDFNFNKNS